MALRICFTLALLSVTFADPSWKRVETVNNYVGRGETSFAKCGAEKLCLIGGRGDNRVTALDTKALVWSPGKTGPFQMHHFQAVYGPDGCVWIAGAWTGGFPAEDTVDDIWAYCRADDKWEKRVSIPRPRGAGGAVFYNGKLYLVSGNVGGHNPNAKVVPWFDCYDPATGTWSELPDVPNPRDHFHAVVIGSKLYVAGGRFSTATVPELFTKVTGKVDVFDFKSGEWSPLPDLPRPRGGVAAVEYDSTVMLLGGESERASAWTEVDILRSGDFVPFDDMPDPRHGTGAVSCNGAVWIAGGVRVQGGGDASVETYAFFDGDTPPVCTDTSSSATSAPPSTSSGTSSGSSVTSAPPSTSPGTSSDGSAASAPPSTSSGTSSGSSVTSAPPSTSSSTSTGSSVASSGAPSPSASPTSSDDDRNDDDTFSGEGDDSPSSGTGDDGESSASDPQSPAGQDESASNSEPVCFPSDATVQLEDGSQKEMDELRIGDRVKVAHPDEYSEVYFFSHRHPNVKSKSIVIETSVNGVSLKLSPGHLVYSNGSKMPASAVRVGDILSISHSGYVEAKVTKVSVELTSGLHNPHTLHGDIIVNRVVASTYTSTLPPPIARMMLFPFKAAYMVFGATSKVESLNGIILRVLDVTFWRR